MVLLLSFVQLSGKNYHLQSLTVLSQFVQNKEQLHMLHIQQKILNEQGIKQTSKTEI